MKRKVFLQNALIYLFPLTLGCAIEICFIVGIIGTIWFGFPVFFAFNRTIQIVVFFLGLCVWTYEIIKLVRNRIILEQDRIFVPENWGKGIEKKQYKVEVNYADIEGIFIAETQKDSLNLNDCSALPMPYIVIDCKNGDQKLINMYWYSKKRLKTILDEIIARARYVGNDFTSETGEEIYNTFLVKRKEEYRELKEKRDFLQERKMTRTISSIISPYGYKIDYFRYYPNVFGNIVLKIKKGDIIETFITDRGEIYYNDKMVAKSENTLNLQKQLLRVISDIVSKED